MKSYAWQVTSVGARATFLELKSNYNKNAQNAVFLSARTGASKLGVNKDTVTKWMHELEHYGFIVEVQGAHLGASGVGKAARYRLTDSYYAGQAPTYDFQNWDGVLHLFSVVDEPTTRGHASNSQICFQHTDRFRNFRN